MWNGRKIDILEHTQKGKKKEGVGGIFFKIFAKKPVKLQLMFLQWC